MKIWHSSTYRLETTLNYGLERVWSIAHLRGSNDVAIGYDEGSVMIKVGGDSNDVYCAISQLCQGFDPFMISCLVGSGIYLIDLHCTRYTCKSCTCTFTTVSGFNKVLIEYKFRQNHTHPPKL